MCHSLPELDNTELSLLYLRHCHKRSLYIGGLEGGMRVVSGICDCVYLLHTFALDHNAAGRPEGLTGSGCDFHKDRNISGGVTDEAAHESTPTLSFSNLPTPELSWD